MYFGKCHKGAHPDIIPGIVLHVDDRFLYPEFRGKTAESISEELSSFSLTILVVDREQNGRVFSSFGRIIKRLWYGKASVPVPKAPGQTTINGY